MNIHLDIVALRNKVGALLQQGDEVMDGLDQLEQRLDFQSKQPKKIYVNLYQETDGSIWSVVHSEEAIALKAKIKSPATCKYLGTKEITI